MSDRLNLPAECKRRGTYEHYAAQVDAVMHAAGFERGRYGIADIFATSGPLVDLTGGDKLDYEVIVVVACRPLADAVARQRGGDGFPAEGGRIPASPSWFHQHARVLLIGFSKGTPEVWILGGMLIRQGVDEDCTLPSDD